MKVLFINDSDEHIEKEFDSIEKALEYVVEFHKEEHDYYNLNGIEQISMFFLCTSFLGDTHLGLECNYYELGDYTANLGELIIKEN